MSARAVALLFAGLATTGCASGAHPTALEEGAGSNPPALGEVQGPGEIDPDELTRSSDRGASLGRTDGGVATKRVVSATNPVLGADRADPHVTRVVENGTPTYYLVHTSGSDDIPIYKSTDLLTWQPTGKRVFGKTTVPGQPVSVNDSRLCHIWAPQIVPFPAGFLLSFTAVRYKPGQTTCPGYAEDSGVYLASAKTVTGPYANPTLAHEPFPSGTNEERCSSLRPSLPRSVAYASKNCQGGECNEIMRLDSDVFHDEKTGRWWMAYAWYTNTPPKVSWERDNYGEHVSVVELDSQDPFAVMCASNAPKIDLGNPHDDATLKRLASSCTGCDQMLSFTRNWQNAEEVRDGCSWGVVEGASLFRRGEYVYALMSGSIYNSGYYHVFWVAAKNVEDLSWGNASRLVGRYLIPSDGQNFGHGTPVLGPDGRSWYYVYHRMNHTACKDKGDCARDIWVSPIEFENKGDGLGEVYIRPRWPAKDRTVKVSL